MSDFNEVEVVYQEIIEVVELDGEGAIEVVELAAAEVIEVAINTWPNITVSTELPPEGQQGAYGDLWIVVD